jgi:uncharacterized protein
MILFAVVFFLIYGLLHLYLFLHARAALTFGLGTALCLALVMLVMITAPVTVRMSEKAGWDLFARVMAYAGYTWMGLLFLFVCSNIVVDLFRLVAYLAGWLLKLDVSWITGAHKFYFIISLVAVASIATYGYFEARHIKNDTITVVSPKIPPAVSPLRVAQISDVHLGLTVREDRLKRIMELVDRAKPDIFVSTGDLVDGQMDDLTGLLDLLQKTKPRYGSFAITGNHEFYAGIEQALAFTRKAGFQVLRGEMTIAGGVITVVGVDDPASLGFTASSKGENALLKTAQRDKFVLFLKHRPTVEKESLGLFDLQLSGHVHNGQIFPFRFLTRLFFPYVAGLFRFPGDSFLYVNRGSGTWGPPIRFLAPPEVTIIDLVHGSPAAYRR